LFVFCHDFCKKDKNPAKTVLHFFVPRVETRGYLYYAPLELYNHYPPA